MARDDEDEPVRARARLERPTLDSWSIEELRAYVVELRGEIARAEAEAGRKQSHRSAADSVFRRPG
jgi:uncharacterized small protein (DUF1192 family)